MPVLQETPRSWIVDNILGSFAGMFLTMLSIIQGVALSQWSMCIPNSAESWGQLALEESLLTLTTLVIMIGVWHAYFWLAAIARWVPMIWDSFLMFLVGVVEFVMVLNIGNPAWYYAVCALGVLGGLQYFYNACSLPDASWAEDTKNLGAHIRTYKTDRGQRLILISLGALVATGLIHWGASDFLWVVALVALAGQTWTFYMHVKDQKKTLSYLRVTDGENREMRRKDYLQLKQEFENGGDN